MIDIQREDIVHTFNISDATVGQIGHGFIGNAVAKLFEPHCRVLIYDKAKTGPGYSTLDDVLRYSEVVFVAVPTPMKPSGECHTGIVEEVLQEVQNRAVAVGRDLGAFIVVIKSTVPPGFTRRMSDKFALRIVFSPEFLTEANAAEDFRKTNRVILGGDLEDARIVFKYFEGVWPDRLRDQWSGNPDGIVDIIHCDSTTAELVKLSANAHLAARVVVSNEIYRACQAAGVQYDDVKKLSQLDRRIGMSHMEVPGPDGSLGFGGHCFWKDVNSLDFIARHRGDETNIFGAILGRNLSLRDNRDWEKMEGRAVISEDKT